MLWPDFRREQLFEAVAEYQRRERRLRRGEDVRVAAVILGLVLFAGSIVLAMAGVSAATAVLITAGAVWP